MLRAVVERLVEVLPSAWSVDLIDEPRGRLDWGVDAILSLRAPAGTRVDFLVEAKLSTRGSARATISQLANLAAGRPSVVVTDFANPALRKGCEAVGLGYLDVTGWAYLRADDAGLFVRTQGALRAPLPPTKRASVMRHLDGPGASSVVRTLWDVALPTGVRDLAQRAGVSPGTVAKVLPTLTSYDAVVRGEAGAVLEVNRRELIERWIQDYTIYRSNPEVLWRLAPRGPDSTYAELLKPTTPGSQACALTGWMGALLYLPEGVYPVIPNTLLPIYGADPGILSDALDLRLATPTTANVVLIRPRDVSLLRNAPVSVPLPQVIADLMTMGGRFDELAEQLFETTTAATPTT